MPGTTCDGLGHCPGVEPVNGRGFACQGTRCATGCQTSDDCTATYRCDLTRTTAGLHPCVPRTGASCDASVDNHTLVTPDGSVVDCGRYRCDGSECKTTCVSVLDCVLPNVCDQATHRCQAMADNPASGSCALGATGSTPVSPVPTLGLLAAAVLAGHRARRSQHDASARHEPRSEKRRSAGRAQR